MKPLELWKIQREIKRIEDKALRLSTRIYEPVLRYRHNTWLNRTAQPLNGKLPLGKKIAIFVLFQPKGVAPSVYLTCEHLIARGYSPFILSNSPLTATDRAALLSRSALLLERPNFGYDFGAYQDGIRLLNRRDCRPDRLILLNDSTWFPLRKNDTSIVRMEESGDAFTGHVFNDQPSKQKGSTHVESHFLMFDYNAIQSDAFTEFWKKYRMSSDRINTIEHGEKGISEAMFDAGFTSQCLASKELLIKALENASSISFNKVVTQALIFPDRRKPGMPPDLNIEVETPEWKSMIINQIREIFDSRSPVLTTSFIYGIIALLGVGFVKKAQDSRFHFARAKVLELDASGEIDALDPRVRDEMRASVTNWVQK